MLSHTAEHTEIPSLDVGGLRCDDFAIHRRLEEVTETQGNTTARSFAEEVARAVGGAHCLGRILPPPARLLDVNSLDVAKENTSRHSGLCGKHQEAVIAAVRTGDIEETGRNPQGEPTVIRCGKLYSSYSQYMQCCRIQQYSRCGDFASN